MLRPDGRMPFAGGRDGYAQPVPPAAWAVPRSPSHGDVVPWLPGTYVTAQGACIVGLILVASAFAGTLRSVRVRRKRRLDILVAERAALLTREAARTMALQRDLLRQAHRDPVTGLLVRGELERRTSSKVRDHDGPVAVAMIDVDRFKLLNDRYGHLDGDEVLSRLGSLIRSNLGSSDFAGRYGGDELVVVLDDADGDAGMRVFRLRAAIRDLVVVTRRNTIGVTCSMGMTWIERGDDWITVIERADRAMYRAKAEGRDAIVFGRSDARDAGRERPVDDAPVPGSPHHPARCAGLVRSEEPR